ncbi:unnamed protein product, partial [Closterium sp. NIES-54]
MHACMMVTDCLILIPSHVLDVQIMDPPSPQEEQMLADMFDLCLSGDHQLHSSLLNAITQLSNSFSSYSEVKMSRKELLRMASDAVAGLKLDAQLQRLEAEEERIKQLMDEKMETLSLRSLSRSLSHSSPRPPPSPAAAASAATAPSAGAAAAAATAATAATAAGSGGGGDGDGDAEGVAPPDVSELFGSKPAQPRKAEGTGEGNAGRAEGGGGSTEGGGGEEEGGAGADSGKGGGEGKESEQGDGTRLSLQIPQKQSV